ncbi:hypothetical protein B0T16DRAFT_430960 [Cercophora newfieldiana]|uniref:Uncharacterized protein n=1 Tax=Cercophora newfieldiana TaxID=92897 RepID=A0AA40CL40_9PEZI|nr:hypothetical protein B0T16DRAFT_430960 [Cercophora newfieldiana]
MQVVPSLIGTGTAVAAAAAGLVFGQPPESSDIPRPVSRRKSPLELDTARLPSASSRPGSSAISPYPSPSEEFPYGSFRQISEPASSPLASHPPGYYPPNSSRAHRPSGIQVASPRDRERRNSFIRQADLSSRPIAENPPRESVSSRDSWIRRLSIRPLSQHGSPRSSLAPDSPSLSFSHGSGAPILDSGPGPLQPAPNKLVKRTASGQQHPPPQATLSRRSSKTQMLTLRRPATSHQRSATLQQFQSQGGFSGPPPPAPPEIKYSFDQQNPPREFVPRPMVEVPDPKQAPGTWTSFFHRRPPKPIGGRRSSGSTSDNSPNNSTLPRKRVSIQLTSVPRAYLTKAHWITGTQLPADEVEPVRERAEKAEPRETAAAATAQTATAHDASDPPSNNNSADSTPSKRARRSISMHFSSPGSWISRTGSMRRSKRATPDTKSGGGRLASSPISGTQVVAQPDTKPPTLAEIFTPPEQRQQQQQPPPEVELRTPVRPQPRKRNSSSPLPPLNRISSFNLDVTRLGLSSSTSAATQSRHAQAPANYMSGPQGVFSTFPRSRGPSGERASTLASSDADAREGTSGDEDTDFRSDGVFDSFRTVASSSRVRTVETPLESMFDESPPSTASNGKTKRLSIQEILGRSWDGETKITEEDESLPTPIRTAHLADPIEFERRDDNDADDDDFGFDASPELELVNRDYGRLSLDDDDDDDWARDDDNTLSNHLSPPSSSTNSRRVSPTLRHALMTINGNANLDLHLDTGSDRPRSNIFDWCEPSGHDKFDADGHSPRPKTVHGKQEMDLRGGRSASRKGPSAAHVRSQSVPVVPDPSDASKPQQPKFGTWGLGTKTASEEWDDDFDFEEPVPETRGGKDSATSFSMVVPASIQATQPTVKAHSGQIRELSLLVNDLKRLCRHGRDLDILSGSSSAKWKEAENIIALASPDEEGAEETDAAGPSEKAPVSKPEERFVEEGFDAHVLDYSEDPFDSPGREIGKTTVVRERHAIRRRSVFSPDDEIFGNNWPLAEDPMKTSRPRTPDNVSRSPNRSSAVISTVIEAMQQQRSISDPIKSPSKPSNSKLFFDTNSLQELVKRAGHLRDSLSDAVRRAELLTQSPAGTPRRERHPRHNPDGSPAFTRVFTDPATSPQRRLPKSHSTNSVLSRTSVDSPRMQMMTVS